MWYEFILDSLSLHNYDYVGSPLGVLPYLEFDGKTLSGNGTISRYLAEKYGNVLSNLSCCVIIINFIIIILCIYIFSYIYLL